MIEVIQIPILNDNYTYLLHEKEDNIVASVDPGLSEPIIKILEKKNLRLDFIFNTHHHHDHVGGNLKLKQKTNCLVIGPESERKRIPGIDIGMRNNDARKFGKSSFIVFETPGHTLGDISFYFPNESLLFCGDTLFSGGCGRLFEGTAKQMWKSLKFLRTLPDDTLLYCGHEYTESNLKFAISLDKNDNKIRKKFNHVQDLRKEGKFSIPSLLKEEKEVNPFLKIDDPHFKKKVNLNSKNNWETFDIIRKMKDNF